jgi:hypothetical protein
VKESISSYLSHMSQICRGMGSPFTGSLLRAAGNVLNKQTQTGRRMLDWQGDPHADALAVRFASGFHALVLGNMDGELAKVYPPNDAENLESSLRAAILRHDDFLCAWLDHPPQTNETGRSAVLLPGFLMIARETGMPLALREIGSSAGLNLFFDRFRCRYGETDWGDADYPVTLAPQMRGAVPDLSGDLKIASRIGSDIAPLEVNNESDRLRLRSFIWADQTERLARLDAAIRVARQGAVTLEKADAADFVERQLATRKAGECLVLFHSVVWQYLPEETKTAIEASMQRAGKIATQDMPLAWLRMEPLASTDPHPALRLTLWPGGETRTLALADFHGRWMEWI